MDCPFKELERGWGSSCLRPLIFRDYAMTTNSTKIETTVGDKNKVEAEVGAEKEEEVDCRLVSAVL